MMTRLTQILAAGGLLLGMAGILVLRVLLGLLAGMIAVTFVVLALFQMSVDKGYKKSLFAFASSKRKILDGNGS